MAEIVRIRVTWTNFHGAPGYSSFYLKGPLASNVGLGAFFEAVKDRVPNGLTWNIPGEAEVIEDTTGQVLFSQDVGDDLVRVGTGGLQYVGSAGAVVGWKTADFKNGRRVRGRTFLVPLVTGAFDNDGSIETQTRADIQAAADALIAGYGDDLVVWSRPTLTTPGSSHSIVSATVPDLAAVTRSRRD